MWRFDFVLFLRKSSSILDMDITYYDKWKKRTIMNMILNAFCSIFTGFIF